MRLNQEEKDMLEGKNGKATQKSMEILITLGDIFEAENMIEVYGVQIAGVSYDNLGEAGLEFLNEMAEDGKVKVLTTLNPAGMDRENWQVLGIDEEFAINQNRAIDAFAKMGIITTCSCTPYLIGNSPHYGQHIAWAESSAVCYSNSVIGARTNREGGPSALAAALTGRTPNYGYHLDKNRHGQVLVSVNAPVKGTDEFGVLGKIIGDKLVELGKKIPYITGIPSATVEELKSFCASVATYGGTALFHMDGITPEYNKYPKPSDVRFEIIQNEIESARAELIDDGIEIDFVSIGCPHASIHEIANLAKLLEGKKVKKEFWITTARPTKKIADEAGYTKIIEGAGAKFAADTCCVVAPIKGRFKGIMVDSAKACYYGRAKNKFKVKIGSIEQCIEEATR
ncbi:MAG TPA: aconitase X catalytic domain-containing protein [Candidatus Nanopelagicaceae bacterium]|nr:aconitase X catalytic domain-containing protein [Candidatus Nanopelagicaceae bacterium]